MNVCVICGKVYTDGWAFTCSQTCHDELINRLVAQFGEFRKVIRMRHGVAYKVPTRDVLEKSIREQDLDRYPLWEEGFRTEMIDQADKLTFLKTLEEAGLHFEISVYGVGCVYMTPAQVLEYEKDPQSGLAMIHGVTVEHWRAWYVWMEAGFPCYGITRRGTQCKLGAHRVDEVRDFQPGVSEYCEMHLGQSALHRNHNDFAVTLRPER